MEITLTTPALLFPAVAFLLVAYTSRFLAIGARIRNLHEILLSVDALNLELHDLQKREHDTVPEK